MVPRGIPSQEEQSSQLGWSETPSLEDVRSGPGELELPLTIQAPAGSLKVGGLMETMFLFSVILNGCNIILFSIGRLPQSFPADNITEKCGVDPEILATPPQ